MANHKRIRKVFCTTREAAELLNVSLRTAQLWVEKGLLEAWKTSGGHRRITRQSIERMYAEGSPDEASLARSKADIIYPTGIKALDILVVEDDPNLRRLYKIKIGRWQMPINLSTVEDGVKALTHIDHAIPDLLILDLKMTGMDGFHMLNAISNVSALAGLSIVVVSGMTPEEIARHGAIPKGIPVLSKPIPFEQLRKHAEVVAAKCSKPRK